VNKLRWSISTAFSDEKDRYPFQASQLIATVYAQEILELVKFATETPGVLGTTSTIRNFKKQSDADAILDKLDRYR